MSTFAFLLVILLIPPSALCVPITGILGDRGNVLLSGDRLNTNEALTNGNLVLRMQDDCNLVVYDNGNPVWASQTANQGTNCFLLMQNDGTLVLYDGNWNGHWAIAAVSLGWDTYAAILQSDRRVFVYGGVRWGFSF